MRATVFKRRPRAAGATLVELIITIVLMGIVMVTLATTLSFSAQRSSDLLWQVKAVELGQAYLEEITTKRFDENSPVGGVPACDSGSIACGPVGSDGETRQTFDDVDDYHGLDESPPRDPDGNVRGNYTGYRVQVSVAYMTAAQQASYGLSAVTDAKLITVTVSPPTGAPLVFSAYRGNF